MGKGKRVRKKLGLGSTAWKRKRTIRRMAGLIVKYFSDELLHRFIDPRSLQGRRWKSCLPLIRAVLLGLACGCKGLGELEELTDDMHIGVRRLLKIPRRIPDTTLRDFIVLLGPEQLSELLYVVGYDAWRRRALKDSAEFPWSVFSLDAKYPVIRDINKSEFLQVHHNENGEAIYGMLRTVTATLITAAGQPIFGAVPVPGDTNEQGSFQKALGDMVRIYGRLFSLIMYDAGAASQGNADAVLACGKHYFYQLADERWTMLQTIEWLLADKAPVAIDKDIVSSHKCVIRRLSVLPVKPTGKTEPVIWESVRTAFKLVSETYVDGVLDSTMTRFYVTDLESQAIMGDSPEPRDPKAAAEIAAKKWTKLIVLRWGVETSHQVLDGAFAEDDRPWITCNAQGALAIMILRRIAYTIMTLFKSVTQRSDDNRALPFRKVMEWLKDALKWPNAEEFKNLRTRRFALPPALA